ncbi:FAS1 domain-containing protein [Chytridium lagenaria]|nr:FAS1 domain-containing protein [Chytridium lagenaria]
MLLLKTIAAVVLCVASIVKAAPAPTENHQFILSDEISSEDILLRPLEKEGNKPEPPNHTVLFLLEHLDSAKELAKLIAGVPEVKKLLNESTAVTVFAPSNEAFQHFQRFSPGDPAVTDVLLYHTVPTSRISTSLKNGDLVDTLLVLDSLGGVSQKIKVLAPHDEGIFLNHMAKVIKADIKASNGYVHSLDRILVPPPHIGKILFSRPQDFSVLLLALKRAGLVDDVVSASGVAVFAPVNKAFRKLGFRRLRYLFSDAGVNDLRKLLAYHVATDLTYASGIIDAGSITLPTLLDSATLHLQSKNEEDGQGHQNQVVEINEQAHVIFTDILASNGVIHGIDHVLDVPDEREQEYHNCGSDDDEEDDDFADVMEAFFDMDV